MKVRTSPCARARGARVTVRKLDAAWREVYRYPARVLWRGPQSVTVAAIFQMPTMRVGGLLLATGDCFVETYYANRWYNILAVYAQAEGRLRGWYANIGEPLPWTAAEIAYRDLALDLVVRADGRQVVLDEAEFAALPLADTERRRAQQALQAVRRRFRGLCAAMA